jgi:hypothetical protein
LWKEFLGELYPKIKTFDQASLAIISKKIAPYDLPQIIWSAIDERFTELEMWINLKNFSDLAYAFVSAKKLDAGQFIMLTRRALLRNYD